MKTLVFTLFATLLFAFAGHAQGQNRDNGAAMKIIEGKTVTTLRFASIKELEKNSTALLEDHLKHHTELAGDCMITVQIEVSVTLSASAGVVGGEASVTLSASVTAPCSQISAAVRRIRAQLLAAAQG